MSLLLVVSANSVREQRTVMPEPYSPVCNIVDRLNRSRNELRKETLFYRSNVIIYVPFDIILLVE